MENKEYTPSPAPCICGYEEVRHKTCKFCAKSTHPTPKSTQNSTNLPFSDWREEFDKLCTGKETDEYGTMTWAVSNTEMKEFIEKLIQSEVNKAVKEREKELVEKIRSNQGAFMIENPFGTFQQGFFTDDIINLITPPIKSDGR